MKLNFPPRRILAAADMSSPSLAALDAAKSLTRRFGSRLELVYVQDLPFSLLGFGPETEGWTMNAFAAQMADFRRWREARLTHEAADLPSSRVTVRTIQGNPRYALCEQAQASRADLIVMGTHGHSGIDRVVFGSVAEGVARRAAVPVLTVRERRGPFKASRILAPYNLRDYAEPAVLYAARVARGMGGSLTVLFIGKDSDWALDARQGLRRRLERLLGPHGATRLRLSTRAGDPRHEILLEAVKGRCDLIVLAAHRQPFGKGMIMGSTAERVLRHSPAPVISVPSGRSGARTRL